VNLAALKAKLSAHLEYVKTGEEVVVCERNKPIARIVPIHIDDQEEHEKELIARGVMIPQKRNALAAALEWCHDRPNGRVFLTADQRLRQAANLAGFDAKTV
jgi:prevent-host-death family protein